VWLDQGLKVVFVGVGPQPKAGSSKPNAGPHKPKAQLPKCPPPMF